MTLNGAIMELVMLSEHPMMPVIFKPSIQKIIEAVSECEESERKTSRWIPATERLPEELSEVNVTWINTKPESYYDFIKGKLFTGTAVYYKGRWYWYSAVCTDYLKEYGFSPNDEMDDAIKVLAWMPLPEPYKEG